MEGSGASRAQQQTGQVRLQQQTGQFWLRGVTGNTPLSTDVNIVIVVLPWHPFRR